MATVKEIVTYFENIVPPEMKMDFDNIGLLVGKNETEVKTAIVALDITDGVIDEAVACGAQMILSHHPVFFELKQVNDGSLAGRKVTKLLQNGISAFCQHTNLDCVSGGVNDALAATLSVSVKGRLDNQITANGIEYGMGRYGELANPISLEEFLIFVKSSLCAGGIRYYDAGRLVKKVALCGGSGGEYVETAALIGCDTLVTADVKYHQYLAAKELGINLLDAGHFCTENVVVPVIADMLKTAFPDVDVRISQTHKQIVRSF